MRLRKLSDARLLLTAVLALSILGSICVDQAAGQSVIEKIINTTSPLSLNAVNTVYGINLKISIQVQVVWGPNIDVFTLDAANYAKYTAMVPYDTASLNCNYTTFVNETGDNKIDYIKNGSKTDCQGFKADDIDAGNGPIYVVVGFRDRWCKCPSCYSSCAGTHPAPQCSKALVRINVDVAPAMDERIRNLIAIGAVLVLLCGGLGACQFVYNQRAKARERAARETETMGDDMLGESIEMGDVGMSDSRSGRKMNRL